MIAEVLTEIEEIKNQMGTGGDPWNIMIATECVVYNAKDEDTHYTDGTRLQMAGFILHPRRMQHEAFEIVTEDADEVEYLMGCVNTSTAGLMAATAGSHECARQAFGASGFGVYAANA